MQSAHLELNLRPVRLDVIVEEAVALLQPSITARDQRIEYSIANNLRPLMIDEQRIERVIANLVSNAHKYSPKGGLIRIEINREQEDQVLRVIDEGRGINEEEVESVFSPYYLGKLADTSSVQGSGLGLSIARYLTELHEGTLTVDTDTEHSGPTFVLKLPASSLDMLDDDTTSGRTDAQGFDDEAIWPQAIRTPSDTPFNR
jgi:K+-sensing histidine kinase KdpD